MDETTAHEIGIEAYIFPLPDQGADRVAHPLDQRIQAKFAGDPPEV